MNRLLTAFYDTPWAIIPECLPPIRAVLHRWAAGVKLTEEEICAAVGAAPAAAADRRSRNRRPGIGVLPVLGILAQRTAGNVSSPGTATDTLRRQFAVMLADDHIGAIVLDIDSPGGSVFGVQELVKDIFAGRGHKRIVAVANSLAASAAYWIGSAADEFVVTPSGEVGSIGVIAAHEDHSRRLEKEGVEVTLISAGRYKTEGNPFGPLNQEAREHVQSRVNDYYDDFVSAVARHRGTTVSEVRSGFGEGRIVGAREAIRLGMADRVTTFDRVISRLSKS